MSLLLFLYDFAKNKAIDEKSPIKEIIQQEYNGQVDDVPWVSIGMLPSFSLNSK